MVKTTVLKKFSDHIAKNFSDFDSTYLSEAYVSYLMSAHDTENGSFRFSGQTLNIAANKSLMKVIYQFFSVDFNVIKSIVDSYAEHFSDYQLIKELAKTTLMNEFPDELFHRQSMEKFINLSELNGDRWKSVIWKIYIDFSNMSTPVLKTILEFPIYDDYLFVVIATHKYNARPVIQISTTLKSYSANRNRQSFEQIDISRIHERIRSIASSRIRTIIKDILEIDKKDIKDDLTLIKDYCSVCQMTNIS